MNRFLVACEITISAQNHPRIICQLIKYTLNILLSKPKKQRNRNFRPWEGRFVPDAMLHLPNISSEILFKWWPEGAAHGQGRQARHLAQAAAKSPFALELPYGAPTGYGLGRADRVSFSLTDENMIEDEGFARRPLAGS